MIYDGVRVEIFLSLRIYCTAKGLNHDDSFWKMGFVDAVAIYDGDLKENCS